MREDAILWEVKPEGAGPFSGGSLTVSQFQIGIVMQDGEVVNIFSAGKRNLPWKGEVQTYVASTAPFTLAFWLMDPMDREESGDSVVLGQPVLTSDDEVVTAQLDLTMRVVRENVEYLLQLLRPGSSVVTRRDVSDAIKGELLAKVLALDIHQHTAAELRGNRELFRGIYDSVNVELASTIRSYGLRLDNLPAVNWGLTSEERERIRQRRHEEELEEIRRRQEIRQRRHEEELREMERRQEIEDVANRARERERQDAEQLGEIEREREREQRHGVDKFPTEADPAKYRAFWQQLIDTLPENWFKKVPESNELHFSAGLTGVSYRLIFAKKKEFSVDLYIDRGPGKKEWNKWLFDRLERRKEPIESRLGETLEWMRLNNKNASRIRLSSSWRCTINDHPENLKEVRKWMIERLLAFGQVFGPILNELAR